MKRGVTALELVVGAALALIILVILLFIVRNGLVGIPAAGSCAGQSGICYPNTPGFDCPKQPVAYYRSIGAKCPNQNEMCCLPVDPKQVSNGQTPLTAEQQKALLNPFTITLGSNPKSITSLNLNAESAYEIRVTVNPDLPSDSFGNTFYAYLTDSKRPSTIFVPSDDSSITGLQNSPFIGIYNVEPGKTQSLYLRPSNSDSYGIFSLVIGMFKFDSLLKAGIASDNSELTRVVSFKDYALFKKTIPLSIQRPLDITGLGTTWSDQDTITVTCKDSGCRDLQLALVDASTVSGGITDVLEGQCKEANYKASIASLDNKYVDTSGIPINLNIGGFFIPTQKSFIKYIFSYKKLLLSSGKVEVKLDKMTLCQFFGRCASMTGQTNEATDDHLSGIPTGENVFVCAKATGSSGDTYYAVSQTPLKIDALPPIISPGDITIKYPEPLSNNPQLSQQYPSIKDYFYFYDKYPRVIIGKCDDHGQSGCQNYDYYVKTGNFIDLQLTTDDTSTAISAIILTEGLNQLLYYWASKDPLNTVCPPITGYGYRQNTRPEIRIPDAGQGVVCIRVVDKVGNMYVTWKPIWNPEAMMMRIATEAVAVAALATGD